MARYCLNQNQQHNGDYEVHNLDTCWTPPAIQNQIPLGDHYGCASAVSAARAQYPNTRINGCLHCSPSCHTS